MTTTKHQAVTARALHQLGFTEYEARAYVALLAQGELNGYALAKASGIPRANVYAVAEKLVQRGAAQLVERPGGAAYAAVAANQLLHGMETEQRKLMGEARAGLARVAQGSNPPAAINLRGDEVLARAEQLINTCSAELYIALQPAEASRLAGALRAARERGVAITTLCLEGCEVECGGCTGQIHRCNLAPSADSRWLLVVGDATAALLGHVADAGMTAVATEQPLVVELATAYIQQSAALAILGSELSGRFEGLLSTQARHLLDGLMPDGNFLAHMRELNQATPAST